MEMEYKEMMSQIKSAERTLMMNGFQKDIEDEGMYIDYFRHPEGYGIDGRSRLEKVTIEIGSDSCLFHAESEHSNSGTHWYGTSMPERATIGECIADLEHDKEVSVVSTVGFYDEPSVDLSVALSRLLKCPDLNTEELEKETLDAISHAREALDHILMQDVDGRIKSIIESKTPER